MPKKHSSKSGKSKDTLPEEGQYDDGQYGRDPAEGYPEQLVDNNGAWQDNRTPRGTIDLDFQSLSISDEFYLEEEDEYGAVEDPPETSHREHKSRHGKGKGKEKEKGKGKGKGKEPAPVSEEFDGQVLSLADDEFEDPSYILDAGADNWQGGASNEAYLEAPEDGEFEDEVAMAIQESQATAYAGDRPGESSTSYEPAAYDQTTMGYDDNPDPLSSTTSFLHNPSGKNTYLVTGTVGEEEEADPRFRLHSSWDFAIGAVFKILWSEPRGVVPHDDKASLMTFIGEFYVTYRRFIVVATDEGHSTCVPILTYERRGCTKSGAKPKKHGIIYSQGSQPRLLKNEPALGFNSVMLRENHGVDEKLDKASRVNYSKLVTVEHNVKVRFLGMVEAQHLGIVQRAVNECWAGKMLQPVKTSRHRHSNQKSKDHRDKEHKKQHKHH